MIFQIINGSSIGLSFPDCNIINADFLNIRIIYKLNSVIQPLYGIVANLNTKQGQHFTCSLIAEEHRNSKN